MGYRCKVSIITTPQNFDAPSQSTGSERSPSFRRRRFADPNLASICRMPIAPTKGGIIIGINRNPARSVLPGNLYLAVMNARGMESTAVKKVVVAERVKLFMIASPVDGFNSVFLKKENDTPVSERKDCLKTQATG